MEIDFPDERDGSTTTPRTEIDFPDERDGSIPTPRTEIDFPDERDGSTPTPRTEKSGSLLRLVLPESSGEGLPYAPVDWPNPGDVWSWRVGRRVATTGYYKDRYLFLPRRLRNLENSTRGKYGFASKLSVEQFIRTEFPGADSNAFLASFSWKIPAKKSALTNGHVKEHNFFTVPFEEMPEYGVSDSQTDTVGCKAGNNMCKSILEPLEKLPLAAMPCDLCCSEPRFCRDCCCIFCSKTINLDYGGYSYIKCEAVVDEGYICAHIAHIDCALRCYMAGTVGGSIGLDAEYYCRRCDARTDLVPHATRLLQTCASTDSWDDVEKILGVGICILRGSQKTSAMRLLHRFELAIAKLKNGASLEGIWKVDDNFLAVTEGALGHANAPLAVPNSQDSLDVTRSSEHTSLVAFDPWTQSLKLEDEIDHVLLALQKSQESEYKIAEETLHAQKNYLLSLYQQLESEKSDLLCRESSIEADSFMDCVLTRVEQIKRELKKFKDMGKVANGFGRTSKGFLREHFGFENELKP